MWFIGTTPTDYPKNDPFLAKGVKFGNEMGQAHQDLSYCIRLNNLST
jgi:hypothetical protein